MQNVIDKIEWMFAGLGGFLGWFFGGFDGFLYALVVFVVCDYFTGVLAAAIKHELSSEVGFKGIAKKVCIFVLVGIANIIDTQILQNGAAIRTAVVFFFDVVKELFIVRWSFYMTASKTQPLSVFPCRRSSRRCWHS